MGDKDRVREFTLRTPILKLLNPHPVMHNAAYAANC